MLGFRRLTSHWLRSHDATSLCRELERRIETATCKRITEMARSILAMHDGWPTAIDNDFAFLVQATKVRAAIRRARAGSVMPLHYENHLRFQASSLFLSECHQYLTGDPAGRERLHLVSGSITPDGLRVISRMEKVTFEQQSAAYVKADPMATHNQLIELTERDGHDLLAVFHSHISNGADSTQPSQTDIANQQRFAAIGWDAIGGIFSLDGYVRFFSTCKDFDLRLYGNRAEIVSVGRRETIVKLSVS